MSPRLPATTDGLPREAYVAADWFAREQALFRQSWVCAGRLEDLRPGTMRAVTVAGAPVLLTRLPGGEVKAWHNTCRHRGAELCQGQAPLGKLITCPYHAWAYAAEDGRLVAAGPATPARDFRRELHGLVPVATRVWAGFLFVCVTSPAPVFAPDPGPEALDRWPMDRLHVGHRHERVIAANWKVFWENYNECLHCPGIHRGLTDLVPVYRRGIMSEAEAPDYVAGAPAGPALRPGARTWTEDGQPCGPEFPDLTEADRAAAFHFVTVLPSMFVVAHVDYVRAVQVEPLTPTSTRLTATWLFTHETLAQPGFDPARVAAFATTVLEEDAAACEMNQRGLASPAFARAALMPEEFDINAFHRWLTDRLERLP
jgi:Rieske 2Fe-2S family protein